MVETLLLFVGVFVTPLPTKFCLLTENLWEAIMFKMGNFWHCFQTFLKVELRKILTWTTICIGDSIHGRD